MKTVVVGYDGSEAAGLALRRAAELARAFDGSIILAVVDDIVATAAGPIGMAGMAVVVAEPVDTTETRDAWIDEARSVLDELGATYEVVTTVGEAASELVALADERGADLIVVGTSEPGFLERLFMGSVSGAVVRAAKCDVLVVHPKHTDSPA